MRVIQLIEDEYGVKISNHTRKLNIIYPRYQCIYFLRKYCNLSLKSICEYVPITDHSTIIKALKRNQYLIDNDFDYFISLKKLDDEIAEYTNYKSIAKNNILSSH
jgi:chromosomal replication initiation ATPase DnaA